MGVRIGTDGSGSGGDDQLSVEEVEAAIQALDDAGWRRLRLLSRYLARRCGGEEEDILHEALVRALDGRRSCGRATPIIGFIAGVMKSLVSQANEARKAGTVEDQLGDSVERRAASGEPSPEHQVLSRIDDGDTLRRIQQAISGDEQLELLVEGLWDGLKGKELEALLDVDAKGLATIQKRLQRRLAGLKSERKER